MKFHHHHLQLYQNIQLRNKLNKILSDNTGQDIKTIENDTDRDNYMDAKEALNYGLIDKIIKESD